MNFSEINTNCNEGRLLIAAVSIITSLKNTAPMDVLDHCGKIVEKTYTEPLPVDQYEARPDFITAIGHVINRYNRESLSNTPDFILAQYVVASLNNFEAASNARENWYGKPLKVI